MVEPAGRDPTAAETATAAPIRFLEFKVAMLLALTLVLSVAFVAYVLYARGVFESKLSVVLVTDNSDGVNVGSPLTFAGFTIGQVRRIELADDAKVRIHIDVPTSEAKWLRTSSIFVIDKPLVGGVRIRAVTGQPEFPQLKSGAVVGGDRVLRGDTGEEVPRIVTALKTILESLQKMTAAESSLNASLANVHAVTERMAGRSGLAAAALGSEENARKIFATLDRTNALLESLARVSADLDRAIVKADQRVFGGGGVMDETQKAVVQLNAILSDARESLKKADAIIEDTQKMSSNALGATQELAGLRAEVDASLRKVGALIDEVNRKWPFKREQDLKLP